MSHSSPAGPPSRHRGPTRHRAVCSTACSVLDRRNAAAVAVSAGGQHSISPGPPVKCGRVGAAAQTAAVAGEAAGYEFLSDTIDAQLKAVMKAQQEYADQRAAASSSASAANPAPTASAPRQAPSSAGGGSRQQRSGPASNPTSGPDFLSQLANLPLRDAIKAQMDVSPASLAIPQSAASDLVQGVIVRCDMESTQHQPWAKIMLPANDVFFEPPWAIPDIPRLIEIPLLMFPVGTRSNWQPDLDNQVITYMNINAETGWAGTRWQVHVGTVVVARADKKPLLPHHLEGVWMYCDRILGLFNEGSGPPRRLYNRKAFEDWWGRYCEEQKDFRRGTGARMISMTGGRSSRLTRCQEVMPRLILIPRIGVSCT